MPSTRQEKAELISMTWLNEAAQRNHCDTAATQLNTSHSLHFPSRTKADYCTILRSATHYSSHVWRSSIPVASAGAYEVRLTQAPPSSARLHLLLITLLLLLLHRAAAWPAQLCSSLHHNPSLRFLTLLLALRSQLPHTGSRCSNRAPLAGPCRLHLALSVTNTNNQLELGAPRQSSWARGT